MPLSAEARVAGCLRSTSAGGTRSSIDDLQQTVGGLSRFWIDHVYSEKMLSTAGPARRRHLEQVMANEGHLAELSRKAREGMAEPSRG